MYSIFLVSNISLASLLLIPNCNQRTLALILTVSSAYLKASTDGLKTSTISIETLISSSFAKTSSPSIFSPFALGLTGITLYPYFCIYFITIVEALVGSLLTPTIAIVLYFESISLILSFTTYVSILEIFFLGMLKCPL